NKAIDTNQSVIPVPEPGIACSTAESGGYIVQPADAGPDSTNNEAIMIRQAIRKIQYDSMFMKPEAISRAPICSGIRRFEKVPDKPAVNTKNTMIVPWIVTRAK